MKWATQVDPLCNPLWSEETVIDSLWAQDTYMYVGSYWIKSELIMEMGG